MGLPGAAKRGLLELLASITRIGCLPAQAMLVIIALLLKPNGGDRPIALAPFVFRIWTALFVPVIEQWDPSFIEHWDTAVKGSSALRAALARLVKDEIAQHYGQFILSTLWDASKFYDCLDLRKILKEAGSAAMPAAVIRICLTMYLAPRVIKVDTAFGTPLAIYNYILQGCRFANRMCRFGLYGILRDMHHFWPETGPMQYVDDLAQRAAGALHVVHGSMHESGVFLIEAMRRNKIQVSETTHHCGQLHLRGQPPQEQLIPGNGPPATGGEGGPGPGPAQRGRQVPVLQALPRSARQEQAPPQAHRESHPHAGQGLGRSHHQGH